MSKINKKSLTREKVAVITGCNRGTGYGILIELLKEGYTVYGLNRTSLKENLKGYIDVKCDISKTNEVRSICMWIKPVDLLVLNAGIRKFGNIGSLDIDDFSKSIDINLKGAFYVLSSLVEKLKEAHGTVIFIGSHAGDYPFAKGSAYCSSKAGLHALAECFMEEVRHFGVKTTVLSLGSIKNREHGIEEEWKLKPEEIGKVIVSLTKLPENAMPSYINLRPTSPLKLPFDGIELLQYK